MTKHEARQVLAALEVLEIAVRSQCFHCYRLSYDYDKRGWCYHCGGPYLQTIVPSRPALRSGAELGLYDFQGAQHE